MIAKKKPLSSKAKKQNQQLALVEAAVSQIRQASIEQSQQVMAELSTLREDVHEIKQLVERLKPVQSRRGLFRKRRIPVEVEPAPAQPALPVDQLLSLLPHLGKVIPQLKNPKAAETLKILANPAVMSMIQQFLANSSGVKTRPASRVTHRVRS